MGTQPLFGKSFFIACFGSSWPGSRQKTALAEKIDDFHLK